MSTPHEPPCPSLALKVAMLSQAASYPAPVHRVDSIETHMSWVFLAGNFAYKLKKPVRTAHCDFRSLAARHYFCSEELRLNRRLAGAIYIGLVQLGIDSAQRLHLGSDGVPVDWLVKMHRVPEWLLLHVAIAERSASMDDADQIVRALTGFYRTLPAERLAPAAYRTRFNRQIEADRIELGEALYGLPPESVSSLYKALSSALLQCGQLLDERLSMGRVVEGHGDLRPEHICLLPEIAIIDCLEFSRDLRLLDTVDEVGYLALECERLGAPRFSEALLRAYRIHSGDDPPAQLIHFYQSCRASTRTLLAARHLKEKKFRDSPYWRRTAAAYLGLALRHARACQTA